MAKRSSAVPDSFEVDVVSLLRGQVDAIVHELAVAISDIQSDSRKRRPRTTSTASWRTSFPAMREQSARLRRQRQRRAQAALAQ